MNLTRPTLSSRSRHCATLSAVAVLVAGAATAAPVTQPVYTDGLESNWQSWGWATLDFANHTVVHSGTSSIEVRMDQPSQALYLHHDSFGVTTGKVEFWINGGNKGGQQLQVAMEINGKAQTSVPIDPPTANTWTMVSIPLSQLGLHNTADVNGVWIQDREGKPQPAFYVDDITLTLDAPFVAPPPPAVPHVTLTVDAGRAGRRIDARMFGLNTAVWDSHLADPSSATILRGAGIKALRFPGGSTSDDYDWSTGKVTSGMLWSTNIGSYSKLAEKLGATTYLTANYGTGTPEMAAAWVAYVNGASTDKLALGVDSRGVDWKTVGYWASMRGDAPLATDDGQNFLRVHHPKPYGYRYWEIGNECYGNWEADSHGKDGLDGKVHDGFTYATYATRFLKQMRAVDPSIKIGIVSDGGWDGAAADPHAALDKSDGKTHSGFTPVALATLAANGAYPDFVVIHRYVQLDGTHQGDLELLLTGSDGWAADVANTRKMITDYMGTAKSRGIELDVTETNSGSQYSKEGTSLTNGLFLADTIATLMQTEAKACLWWDFRNSSTKDDFNPALYGWRPYGDDGMVSVGNRKDCPLNTLMPPYYGEKLLTRWASSGDVTVGAKSDRPEVSIYAVRRTSGELTLLVINKQKDVNVKASIKIAGFGAVKAVASGYRYGKPEDRGEKDLTPVRIDNASNSFTAAIPAYSMTVIALKRK